VSVRAQAKKIFPDMSSVEMERGNSQLPPRGTPNLAQRLNINIFLKSKF
jgi:hypothetical protein